LASGIRVPAAVINRCIKIEIGYIFNYIFRMIASSNQFQRRGARRMRDVPPNILALLSEGRIETVNLMEWLAADMAALARSVAERSSDRLRNALIAAAEEMPERGVTERLMLAGRAIAETIKSFKSREFESLATHPCDLVRQWACYALNDGGLHSSLEVRLRGTLRFAADRNMTVREAAWMAFRPHLYFNLDEGLAILEPVSRSGDENLRRFAIEVTRPRSVWGAHIEQLKRSPNKAFQLLDNVCQDRAKYVQLAVGNWLNDASKTRPDWVVEVCARWTALGDNNTAAIVRRGLRTLVRQGGNVWADEKFFPELLSMRSSAAAI
jgi:3-methyladenine DNA glycosylase AlkC